MKSLLYFLLISLCLIGCNASKPSMTVTKNTPTANITENDTVRIENDSLEYEVLIIEPGFNYWLASTAKPKGYYTQQYLEAKNYVYVVEWNIRVNSPNLYDPLLYELPINYRPTIDYGYDVNYKMYNYFIYFQLKYNQKLSGYVPRN